MSEFEVSWRTAEGRVTQIVEAADAEAAELKAPFDALEIDVKPLRRRGPSCRATDPAHWPARR